MDKKNISFDKLRFYYGIPHSHTSLSTGKSTPTEALEHARSRGLDFLIITDHNKYLSENITEKNKEISKWTYLNKCINKFNKKHSDFLALPGFEAKSTPLGHLNIICPNTFFTGIVSDMKYLLLWLINDHTALLSINHPKNSISKRIEFTPLLDKLLCSIEVGNGIPPNNYTRYDSQFFSLLDKGFKIGAINSQDNHKLNYGDSENLTCVVSHKLDKSTFLSALKDRHIFSTESKTLKMLFSLNSTFMGGTAVIDRSSKINLYLQVEDNLNKISKIQFLTNKGKIIKEIDDINLYDVKYIFEKDISLDETWFVAKVFLNNDREAMSSPIFVTYE
ncbi:CehA/McbA family metallohydrolase [Clostridium perfringens]|nr:CehA/McbA family metallohydrolase [Clostridium perfringens]